tara:strand:- start:2600 stop:2821 length:222 start_codon:yes stop_codon:yes gene_type:complete
MANENEANLISFSVLIDTKGKIITEQSVADISVIKEKLPVNTYYTAQTIIRVAKEEISKLHSKIETELDARKY